MTPTPTPAPMVTTTVTPSASGDQARSAAFALFSGLVASPFDSSLPAGAFVPDDLRDALGVIEAALPYAISFSTLNTAAPTVVAASEDAAREYAAIFEVGRDGPPLPIREELLYDETKSAQKKEELVRFYDHFAYPLQPERQWAPDHLAIAFEFQHFLAFRAADAAEPEPFLLASRDFSSRHLDHWTGSLAEAVAKKTGDPYLCALFAAVALFVQADLKFLQSRLQPVEPRP